jgi:hypothetical protein
MICVIIIITQTVRQAGSQADRQTQTDRQMFLRASINTYIQRLMAHKTMAYQIYRTPNFTLYYSS